MSLEGSWSFEVTHGGRVYKCKVDDADVTIEAPSGMNFDAKWTPEGFEDQTAWEGDIPGEEIPEDVIEEAEGQMRGMAEAVDP